MGVDAEGNPEMFSAAKFSNENTKVTSHGNPHHFQNNEGVSTEKNILMDYLDESKAASLRAHVITTNLYLFKRIVDAFTAQ